MEHNQGVQYGQQQMWPNQSGNEWNAPFQLYATQSSETSARDCQPNSTATSAWTLAWPPPPPPPPPPLPPAPPGLPPSSCQWPAAVQQQQQAHMGYDHYQARDSRYLNPFGYRQTNHINYSYIGAGFPSCKPIPNTEWEWGQQPGTGFPKEDVCEDKTQREMDQEHLNNFLAERGLVEGVKIKKSDPKKRNLKISELSCVTKMCVEKIERLQAVHQQLKEASSADESTWATLESEAVSLKHDLEQHMSSITPQDVRAIKQAIKMRNKKRARIRNQKQMLKTETQERIKRRLQIDKKITEWQESIRNASLAAEMERQMKNEADTILSEVRKKQADANRLLELVKAVVTLRNLRKQSTASKSMDISNERDEHFSKMTTDLTTMLTLRLEEYGEEERALQVMLDEEQQVTRSSALKLRQQQQLEKLLTENQEKLLSLFGSKDLPTFSYWTYHTLADTNLDALIQVRKCWDSWLVSSETTQQNSSIPLGWVTPVKPSSQAWNPYLDKST